MISARTAVTIAALVLAALVILVVNWRPGPVESPTLFVDASYPGATAAEVEETIAAPIEQQVNGVEHLRQMRSRCGRDGSYTLELSFAAGTDLDLAQTLVQSRVGLAAPILPAKVQRTGVTIRKRSPRLLMLVVLRSPDARFDANDLGRYATIHIKDELARLPGIAEISIVGRHDLAIRIRLDPDKLAFRNLTVDDVARALERQDLKTTTDQPARPAGAADLTLDTRDALARPEEIEAIVIRADAQGHVTRLRDVSRLELGTGRSGFASLDGKPVAILTIDPLSQARPRDVSDVVQARLAELRKRFPDGVDTFAGFDFSRAPTAEAPGYLVLDVDLPVGASIDETQRVLADAEQSLRQLPGVRNVLTLSEEPFVRDRDQPCLVVGLGPAKGAPVDRERLIREIREQFTATLPAAGIRVRNLAGVDPPVRLGYPINFAILGPDRPRLHELADQLVMRMSQDQRLIDVWAGPRPVPGLSVDIDRAKAMSLGVAAADFSAAIEAALGRAPATDVRLFGRTWPVRVQVGSGVRTDIDVWNRLRVRNGKGEMVPLRAIAAFRREIQPSRLERFDLIPAVSITASLASGLTPAEARFVCERLAEGVLPQHQAAEYRLVWLRDMPDARAPASRE